MPLSEALAWRQTLSVRLRLDLAMILKKNDKNLIAIDLQRNLVL